MDFTRERVTFPTYRIHFSGIRFAQDTEKVDIRHFLDPLHSSFAQFFYRSFGAGRAENS